MENFDYHNFDKMEITVKEEHEEEILRSYALFGWEKSARTEDKIYLGAIHLTFVRPHKIKNKDRLQFLQVGYENIFNEYSDCEKNKFAKSAAFILSSVLVWLILTCTSVVMAFSHKNNVMILGVVGVVLCALGLSLCVYIFARIRKSEIKVFERKKVGYEDRLEKVLCECKLLTGDMNET